MHRHAETRFLPFTPKQMFDLVADVGRYPEFLPWCIAARVTGREDGVLWADLVVGKGPFRESFTSKVTLIEGTGASDSARLIDAEYIEGPMREMTNRWVFRDAPGGTEVDFLVELEFKSRILEGLMGAFFDDAVRHMVGAFEARAGVIYGAAGAEDQSGRSQNS